MNHHQSSKHIAHIANMYIHVATHFNHYCYRYHIPRDFPNTMVICDVKFLWYDIFNSKAAVKRPLVNGLNEAWAGAAR